jgi:hypothetical protein
MYASSAAAKNLPFSKDLSLIFPKLKKKVKNKGKKGKKKKIIPRI